MQRKLTFLHRSEEEEIKEAGFTLDFDEIARKGAMSKEEKLIAKWYGIYGSRHPGNHMARVVVPGGVITSSQARNLCKVAEDYGMGVLNVTTRQAIQLHWLKVGSLADMIRDLSREGSTTMHGCGDVARNVVSCPLAETCKYRRLNVRKFAVQTDRFLRTPDLKDLPRKFKINYSGCPAECAQPYINCIGAVAVLKEVDGKIEEGFKVAIGGGMGWNAFVGQDLFTFVPKDKMLNVARAIALMYRDHGDRYDRTTSRLKYVVHRKGIEFCRDIVIQNLKDEDKSIEGISTESFKEAGAPVPERPLTEEHVVGTDGLATVDIMIQKGELNYRQLKDLAILSEMYGDQRIYTTQRQNVQIKGVEPAKVDEVKAKAREIGFETEGFYGLKDIVPCVGTTYCPKAVTKTRDLYDILRPIVSQAKYKAIEKYGIVNITGCPNSCSPYRITDLGFRGMRIREDIGSVEGYEMLIGGDQKKFGMKLGEFKVEDIAGIVEQILDIFVAERTEEETLTQFAIRVGVDRFKEEIFAEHA